MGRENTRRIVNLEGSDGIVSVLERDVESAGHRVIIGIAGENSAGGWPALSSVEQIALARQADMILGPSGNELGLGAFMRRWSWLVELMPKAVQTKNKSFHEFANCNELVDGNPGSLVGHVALRADVY